MRLKTVFSSVQAVLFDLDGTLIDSAPDLGAATDQLRTARGLPSLPLAHYRPLAGAGARGMLKLAFDMGTDHPDYEAYREEFYQNYERNLTARTTAFAGVSELLRSIEARGLLWGIVTNKSKRFTDPLCAQMSVLRGAATIISGDTTPHAKPHPAPLLEAARRLGVQPQQCIYVGDDERDIAAGRAAGMPTVAALYGYLGTYTDIAAWRADASIAQPLDLLNLLA